MFFFHYGDLLISLQHTTCVGIWHCLTRVLICSNGTKTKLVRLLNSKGKALNPALQPQPDPNAEWRRLDAEASAGGRRNRRRCAAAVECLPSDFIQSA